ncbi:radical SAM protein [Candidatus Woesearchaeota archaeon]|nr:radical SAM protein [Candidatus Woesearchaeota archaeon]
MVVLKFESLGFREEKKYLVVSLYKLFSFKVDKKILDDIGKFRIKKHEIEFENIKESRAIKKFNFIISSHINNLTNDLTKKNTIYIHQNSGIPLMGSNSFGIVDRGTNLIELKPISGCNLDCIYCSVNQDKRTKDIVIEREYLVEEFKKLVEFKDCKIEAHIGGQGEPFLYNEIVELVKDLIQIKNVKLVSIDTNGTLLTKNIIDELAKLKKVRLNYSINAINYELAKEIGGKNYNAEHAQNMARYAAKKMGVMITPVIIFGVNDKEMGSIMDFAIDIGAGNNSPIKVGFQNFLRYRFGKNPAKSIPWPEFHSKLKELEKKYNTRLILDETDFKITKVDELPKPFKKDEIVKVKIVGDGRIPGEKIAVARDRVITLPDCNKKGNVNVKITRTKHNIFMGEVL